MYNWNWEKLPKHEYNKVIENVNMGMVGPLMQIHNKYELSDRIFCCSNDEQKCKLWFAWAVETNIITFQDE